VLQPQLLICGFGSAGKAVANAYEQRGLQGCDIAIVERSEEGVGQARSRGFGAVFGDATDPARLRIAGAGTTAEIIICVADDATAAVTAAVRKVAPCASIKAVVEHSEAAIAARSEGANLVLVLSEIAGQVLAETAFLCSAETRPD